MILKSKDEIIEIIKTNVGFRTVTIEAGNLCVNGTPILINGVNRHDHDPYKGRAVTYELMKKDIEMMKQHNINAVRTAHYPNSPVFYNLCDYYGLYVIEEADLECHGFEMTSNYNRLSDDKTWENAYLDRVERMVKEIRTIHQL